MELWNYGITELRIGQSRLKAHSLSILFEDYGQQTTDNGGQSRLIAQGSQPFSTFYTLLYLLSPFDFCLLALSLLSDCEASAVATCSLVVSWTCSLLSA